MKVCRTCSLIACVNTEDNLTTSKQMKKAALYGAVFVVFSNPYCVLRGAVESN
jgi:hypothetical protein